MHWADKIAETLIDRHPGREEFHFASGTTPSGPVHCGNLRDILTNWFVARAVMARGKRVRLLHSWDDYDRFRKVPKNVPPEYEQQLGKPLVDVPDPWGEYPSYAARYERMFEEPLTRTGIELEYRYQAAIYRSGQYNAAIVEAVKRRREIYDIISSFRTQKGTDEERERYLPVEIYCPVCDKDTTRITSFEPDGLSFTYRCKCGHEGSGDVASATNLKLPWKVDWAMRWRHEQIVFEPGGKDHGTAGGSYEVASRIAREIFGIESPMFQVYEFVGIKGIAGKMSGSSGTVITLDEALAIYQPEVLLWVFARIAPNRAFDLVVDRQIFQVYDEYDRAAAAEVNSADHESVALASVRDRKVYPVPFRQLASFSGIVRGNRQALADIFERLGTPYTEEQFGERLDKAEAWIKTYAPEEDVRLAEAARTDYFNALPAERKEWIRTLHQAIEKNASLSLEAANDVLYAIPQAGEGGNLKESQKLFFRDIYQLLFGRDTGPRLATFLAAVSRKDYEMLLRFE